MMSRLKLLLVAAFWLLLTRLALDQGALLRVEEIGFEAHARGGQAREHFRAAQGANEISIVMHCFIIARSSLEHPG